MQKKISEYEQEAFLEYKRRVIQQHADDYEREKRNQKLQHNNETEVPHYENYLHANIHFTNDTVSPNEDNLRSDLQPTWDDSDLQTATYSHSKSRNFVNNTLPFVKHCVSRPANKDIVLKPEKHSKSDDNLRAEEALKPLMDWPSFEEKIKTKSQLNQSNQSVESIRNSSENVEIISPFTTRRWRGKKLPFQKQKLDREAILQKLSMTEPEEDEEASNLWSRSYSSSNHLHICYINDSCSSADSEEEFEKPPANESNPISPISPGLYGYGKTYMNRLSDTSSPLLESAIIQRTHHQDFNVVRTKQEEFELEARYELAQAHQRAKTQAEDERKRNRSEKQSSIAHRVLSGSLSNETRSKMKNFSLSRNECRGLTLGQLQLMLNDMHCRKQSLNDELVSLLISRDAYKTEQDSKLVDIDDFKTMMSEAGPETTV